MNKQDILQTLKSQQEEYLNRFGVSFIGLFGSFATRKWGRGFTLNF